MYNSEKQGLFLGIIHNLQKICCELSRVYPKSVCRCVCAHTHVCLPLEYTGPTREGLLSK